MLQLDVPDGGMTGVGVVGVTGVVTSTSICDELPLFCISSFLFLLLRKQLTFY